jgi:hypothetical protein
MPKRYPEINLPLIGEDGNAYSILGRASKLMRRAGIDKAERDEFMAEATSGDYDNLLMTCHKWFNVWDEDEEEWE